jgi:UDP-N-acetylmuramate: L-alanyl-gamma-D-glutamyl-meso-diaminopimelate ligase
MLKNKNSTVPKVVHLMGIGGSAMACLAGMFKEIGWNVQGTDGKIYPPASTMLEKLGVKVFEGYDAKNLHPHPDLVVVGNVISRPNPEAQELLKLNLPYVSMPQALEKYFLQNHRRVVISGTHGKTTTTSLMTWILDYCGRKPGFFVGGMPLNFGQGFRVGAKNEFVLEGDEYDTAFWEKTPKFLHYGAQHVVMTSVEFDHADIYRDLDHVIEQFEKLVSIIPSDGSLVACGESQLVKTIASKYPKVKYYGFSKEHDFNAQNLCSTSKGMMFDVYRKNEFVKTIEVPLLGKHNVLNVVACLCMGENLGLPLDKSMEAIVSFKGVKKRQERIGEVNDVVVYEDFAHHPTAIAETIEAFVPMAKARNGKLWALFEPRSNTVRRKIFQDVLPKSFMKADEVVMANVFKKADSLSKDESLDPLDVVNQLITDGKSARYLETQDIVPTLVSLVKKGDVVLFMSNGDFQNNPRKLIAELEAKNPSAVRRRC